jgi:hypothetical protein
MKDHGFQDKELVVTEIGVLPKDLELTTGYMPKLWVQQFMYGAFEWMRTATDPGTGCPRDGYRLVQRWNWFSLDRSEHWNGSLFDIFTSEITEYGLEFANYNAQFLPAAPTDVFFQRGWTGYAEDTDVWIGPLEARPRTRTLEIRADGQGKPLLRFDLSTLPRNVQVLSATLTLRTAASLDSSPLTVNAYGMKRAWDLEGVDWTRSTTGTMWAGPGCSGAADREMTPVASVVLAATQTSYAWDVTELARRWVADPSQNYGLLLEGQGGGAGYYTVFSSDQTENPPNNMHRHRPKLELWVQLPLLPTPTAGPSPTPTQTPTLTATPTRRRTSTPTLTPTLAPQVACFQQGVLPRADYQSVFDTYLDGTTGTPVNYGQSAELQLRYDSMRKMLLRWDLQGQLPANLSVVGASLELYAFDNQYLDRTTRVLAYEVLRPWSEEGATWVLSSEGQPWEVQGCGGVADRSFSAAASTIVQGKGQWQYWTGGTLAELVQRWIQEPESNLGLVLAPISKETSPRQEWSFYSSQVSAQPALRPRLCVTYFAQEPTPTAPTDTPSPTTTVTRLPTSSPSATGTRTPTATVSPTLAGTHTATATLPGPSATPSRTAPGSRHVYLPMLTRHGA